MRTLSTGTYLGLSVATRPQPKGPLVLARRAGPPRWASTTAESWLSRTQLASGADQLTRPRRRCGRSQPGHPRQPAFAAQLRAWWNRNGRLILAAFRHQLLDREPLAGACILGAPMSRSEDQLLTGLTLPRRRHPGRGPRHRIRRARPDFLPHRHREGEFQTALSAPWGEGWGYRARRATPARSVRPRPCGTSRIRLHLWCGRVSPSQGFARARSTGLMPPAGRGR